MNRAFHNTQVEKIIVLALLFMAVLHVRLAWADDALSYKSVPPLVKTTIDRTAIIALRHVSEARSDIHRKELTKARQELAEAARLMESIREDLSTAPAKNLIRIARKHLEYEPARRVLQDLLPIYSALAEIDVYIPTDKAASHLDRARNYLKDDDKIKADRELALADRSLVVIEVDLPLLGAERSVAKGVGYLGAGDQEKADEALQSAERRGMSLYTGVHSPLYLARQNLRLALRNFSDAAKAGQYLERAGEYLTRGGAGRSATSREEAGKLAQEVAELEKKLAGGGTVAESSLTAVWEKCTALVERSAAYVAADMDEEEPTFQGENGLIEAKLHVAYAETYQVTLGEPAKAVRELDAALSFLQGAKKSNLTYPETLERIGRIEKTLLTLKDDPQASDPAVRDRYESAEVELSDLIREI